MKNLQIAVISAKKLEAAFCGLAEAFRKSAKPFEMLSNARDLIQKNRSKYHH